MTTTEKRPQTASDDQMTPDTHRRRVVAGPNVLANHDPIDAHIRYGGEDPHSVTTDQAASDTHSPSVGGDGAGVLNGHSGGDTHASTAVAGSTSPAAKPRSSSVEDAPPGISVSATDHRDFDAHPGHVGGALICAPEPATRRAIPNEQPLVLVDTTLAILANRVADLEEFRKACGNRLFSLTNLTPGKDGKMRGYGLAPGNPVVVQQDFIITQVKALEDQAVKELERHLKKSPLGPWVLRQKGLGYKTIARLLAATGDPYWNSLHNRPRMVSELRTYCGYGDPVDQRSRKGQQHNHSAEAKMRGFNCVKPIKQVIQKPCYSLKNENKEHIGAVHVEGCTCSPYRVLYDETKARYVGSLHPETGEPRTPGHLDQIALRRVTKELLKNLWHEAKRLHELPGDQRTGDTRDRIVAGAPLSSGDQTTGDTHRDAVAGGPTSSA